MSSSSQVAVAEETNHYTYWALLAVTLAVSLAGGLAAFLAGLGTNGVLSGWLIGMSLGFVALFIYSAVIDLREEA